MVQFGTRHTDIHISLHGNQEHNNKQAVLLPLNTVHYFCMVNHCIPISLLHSLVLWSPSNRHKHMMQFYLHKYPHSGTVMIHIHQFHCYKNVPAILVHNCKWNRGLVLQHIDHHCDICCHFLYTIVKILIKNMFLNPNQHQPPSLLYNIRP